MATKKKNVGYKEPARYFNDDMKKAADEWEQQNGGKKSAPAKKAAPAKKDAAPAKKAAPVKKK